MSRTTIGVVLVTLAVLVIAGVAALRTLPVWRSGGAAEAKAVPPGDQEIAWIDAATSGSAWERFIAAIHWVKNDRPDLQLQVVEDSNAFPRLTTAVPEIALSIRGGGRLWIRWYKLTNEMGISEWVAKLAQRDPPPLAVIGGGTSDRAAALAQALAAQAIQAAPLLLITTATADHVFLEKDQDLRDLMDLHPGRSFRFCFTNRQMAKAVMDFLWRRDDLREQIGPVYRVIWDDDPYSIDLANRFREVVNQWVTTRAAAWQWIGFAAAVSRGAPPYPAPSYGGPIPGRLRLHIPYSVGSFDQPNRPEKETTDRLIADLVLRPPWQQAVLCLPATTQSARRFLRGLERSMPELAGRIVVATGDSFDFDTVYRDRRLTWPIQDLPFRLVFFSHRDPVDERVALEKDTRVSAGAEDHAASGTEDLLLYADIVRALAETAVTGNRPPANARELAERLRAGQPARFDGQGNRLGGTGEHLVYLRPHRANGRVLPRSTIEVWRAEDSPSGHWALRKSLPVDYHDFAIRGGGVDAGR